MRAKDRGSFNIFTPPSSAAGGMFEAASAGNADCDADEPVGARPSQKGFVASPSRLGAGRSEIVRLVPAHTSLAKARAHAERFKRFRQSRVPHCPALPRPALPCARWAGLLWRVELDPENANGGARVHVRTCTRSVYACDLRARMRTCM
jgi:hypothetical protein